MQTPTVSLVFEGKCGKLHRQACSLHLQLHLHLLTVTVRTHTHTHSDDKRGHGAHRAVIYTVSTPSGHGVSFQKHTYRCWLGTYSTYMCSLCQDLACVRSLWKIYNIQVRYTVNSQVCVRVFVCVRGTLLISAPCLPVCCSPVVHKHRCVTRPSL